MYGALPPLTQEKDQSPRIRFELDEISCQHGVGAAKLMTSGTSAQHMSTVQHTVSQDVSHGERVTEPEGSVA